jgi:hypothetical protein
LSYTFVSDVTENALFLNENRRTPYVSVVVKPDDELKGVGNTKKELPKKDDSGDRREETGITKKKTMVIAKTKVKT